MGINLAQFDKYVLEPILAFLHPAVPYTVNGLALTRETVWHESDGLQAIAQYGDGPARGLGQCEKPTFTWMTRDYLPNQRPDVWQRFGAISAQWPSIPFDELAWNLRLAVALVRCRYLPDSHPIPNTVEARGAYYSRVYQTTNDPVKMAKYIASAKRIA